MLALPPCAIGIVAFERHFDTDVCKLIHEGFRFSQMTADIDFSLLEENQQARYEIALGDALHRLFTGLAISRGYGDRHQTAGQLSAAQEVHDGSADTGSVDDEGGRARVQFGPGDEAADVLDDRRVVKAEGKSL